MKLISLQLRNFRQFYGDTPPIFLSAGAKNTTVIYGNNGSGKTTILAAFTWVLYEQTPEAFTHPNLLINKRALAEAEFNQNLECWVKLEFEHDHNRYQLKRKCHVYQDINGQFLPSKTQLEMQVSGDDGRWQYPEELPEDIINRILPQTLHQYFFFDGEQIDHISRFNHQSRLAEDTRELIGLKVLNRAVEHLKKAEKTLQQELKDIGTSQIKQLFKDQTTLIETQRQLENQDQQVQENIQLEEQKHRELNSQLMTMTGLEETQKNKLALDQEIQDIRANLVAAKTRVKKLISQNAWIVYGENLGHLFQQILLDLKQEGNLNCGIKQELIEQILTAQKCICGEEVYLGSEKHYRIKNLLNQSVKMEVEEELIRLDTKVKDFDNLFNKFWQNLDQEYHQINHWRQQLALKENQLDELKDKLRNYPATEIKLIQTDLDQAEINIKSLHFDSGSIKQKLKQIQEQLIAITKQLEKAKLQTQKQELAKRRIEAAQTTISTITEVKNRLESRFRISLQEKIQEIFSQISFTPYLPRLNENYQLTLVENTSQVAKPVPASTGENQILSLSFIGAIIETVRQWSANNSLMGPDTSTFPVVMDSPFGTLDEQYRRQVAKSMPQLANQLVILVTKTQWRGEVARELESYLGKSYLLVYNSPKADCEEDSLEIRGEVYPLVKRSPNQFEYTEVIEVN